MNESRLAMKAGVGAGILAVLCCVGPLIPILIGVGGATALFGLDKYKPMFIVAGLLVLAGTSWFAVWRRNQCCTVRNRLKDAQIVGLIFGVGITTYLVMQYAVVPALAAVASEKVAEQTISEQTVTATLAVRVDGMTCAGCAVGVQQALLEVPGVVTADVDWQTGFAGIQYHEQQVTPEEILQAKVQEQYTLSIVENQNITKGE